MFNIKLTLTHLIIVNNLLEDVIFGLLFLADLVDEVVTITQSVDNFYVLIFVNL